MKKEAVFPSETLEYSRNYKPEDRHLLHRDNLKCYINLCLSRVHIMREQSKYCHYSLISSRRLRA